MNIHAPRFRTLFLAFLFLNLVGAQILHESGHWAALQLYGRKPLWGISSIVQIWDREPRAPEEWSQFTDPDGDTGWLYLASAPEGDAEMLAFILAGPLVQILAVALGFLLLFKGKTTAARTWGLLFAMVNAFGQTFYQWVSLLRNSGGDEKLIGYYLNLSPTVLHLIFGIFHLAGLLLLFWLLGAGRVRWLWGLAVFLAALPVGPLIMLFNRWIIAQVDAGNPWFSGILGFSLPVFLTGAVSVLALWILRKDIQGSPIIPLRTFTEN